VVGVRVCGHGQVDVLHTDGRQIRGDLMWVLPSVDQDDGPAG
jgi:hypothetical protein